MRGIVTKVFLLLLVAILPVMAQATTKIAVLNLQLHDLTMPLTEPAKAKADHQQLEHNMSMIENQLRNHIAKTPGYQLVKISAQQQQNADQGKDYLFDCASCAAQLGAKNGADDIIVGKLHRPSFLFSYIILRVFNVKQQRLVQEYRTEIKGKPTKSIPAAVHNLMLKLKKDLPPDS